MNKNLLKNPYLLGVLLIFLHGMIGIIIVSLLQLLKSESMAAVSVAGILAASVLGRLYTAKFRQMMDKMQRIKTTATYVIIQLILGAAVIFGMGVVSIPFFIIVMLLLNAVYGLIIYFVLYLGERSFLKHHKKHK